MIANSFDDFVARYEALKQEAKEHGIETVAVLLMDDLLTRDETKTILWSPGPVLAIGMVEYAKNRLFSDSEERGSRR